MKSVCFSLLTLCFLCSVSMGQVSYGTAASYGLRKLIPSYAGKAIQVRRTCDNGVGDIGFTSCGDLDTAALKAFVMAANPLSAISVTAATAYSLRRLMCTYTGSAIRVRSSAAGSPTLDVGFTANGDLDTAALKTFIGANNGFVTTWYDQSGNGRNATQTVTASQPRIVNSGSIERQANRPAVRWLGSGYSLGTSAYTTYTAAACFNGVARVSTDVGFNTIVNKSNSNYPAPLDFYNSQMVIGNGSGYTFVSYGQTFNASLPLSIWTYQASSAGPYNFYFNGGATASGSVSIYADNGNPLILGSRADGVTGLNGWISEVITFDAFPSATDRQFFEWSQSQYYSISGPILATLPTTPASGYVFAWYDQSGNGRQAVQTATFAQPLIVNAGVIEKNNKNPGIFFAGFPQNLVAPLSASVYPVSVSLLANTSGSTSAGAFVKLGTDASITQGGVGIGIGSSGGTFLIAGTSVIGLKEFEAWCPSSPNVNYPSNPFTSSTLQQAAGTMSTYLNGTPVPLSNSSATVGASITGSLLIGGYINSTNLFAVVKISELGVFNTALSNTQRTLLETNQSVYNGVTISNSKYTPPGAGSYFRYVNGVGRESASDSISETRTSVGMGFVVGQSATDFLKDNGDYLTAGIDCPMAPAVSTLNLPGTVVQRWSNDWYLNKTDISANNGTITFYFDLSDYGFSVTPAPGPPANYELLLRNSSTGTFSIVTGTTKSVTGDRIFFSVDASNIPTNNYYTIGSKNTTTGPLPIELVSFEAACAGGVVQVNWVTATQTNNDRFSIERTSDGISYQAVGAQQGAGTTYQHTSYSFTDHAPLKGISYYRLRQINFDGSDKTFKVAEVNCGKEGADFVIYPNPGKGVFIIDGIEPSSDIQIYDVTGKLIFSGSIAASPQKIDLSARPSGIYYIMVKGTAQRPQKLIIEH